MKTKSTFFCQSCGAQSAKWLGRCTTCGEWNTIVEEIVQKENSNQPTFKTSTTKQVVAKPRHINEIQYDEQPRVPTHDGELNRILGGGIVPGPLTLLGGEPGIGKSTLMLQVAMQLKGYKVLYVTGEESQQQVKMRAERLGEITAECFILTETSTQNIFKQAEILVPDVVVIDSIQTLYSAHIESAAGSISQVRECTAELMKYAKETGTPVFLIGHITKEGTIAGPKVLEHMVDVVLQFEGDRHLVYRILRSIKNRFHSTNELGIYEMLGSGLREVSNPSEVFLSQREEGLSGVAISVMLEGNRPFMIEIQSLVSVATYGTPQRTTTGFDGKRLNMILAVLEKRGGFRLGAQDVFLNIAGGIKVEDPGIDLAVCASIISSFEDIAISNHICFAAEVGLGGEIRAVNRIEQRIGEAQKLGFKEIYISKYNTKGLETQGFSIKINPVGKLEELVEGLFG